MTNKIQPTKKKLTTKDLNKVYFRWLLHGESGWNYEKMQALSYTYSMMPALEKIYDDEGELNMAVKNHLQFFNCNQHSAQLILGVNLAIEEEKGIEAKDAITAIKTGLMGPMAGIGDTLFGVIMGTVFGSIAAYMALNGSPVGVYIWLLANIMKMFIVRGLLSIGYREGTKVVESLGTKLRSITKSASILGLTVIGALIPTVVNVNVPFVFQQGDVQMKMQDILDQIMPALVPALLVGFIYWLLGRKGMNSTKVILILIVLSILTYAAGIFG